MSNIICGNCDKYLAECICGHLGFDEVSSYNAKCPKCKTLGTLYNCIEPDYKCPKCGFHHHEDVFTYEFEETKCK